MTYRADLDQMDNRQCRLNNLPVSIDIWIFVTEAPPIHLTRHAFPLRSLPMRLGSNNDFRSASATSNRCWRSAASASHSKPSLNGLLNSA